MRLPLLPVRRRSISQGRNFIMTPAIMRLRSKTPTVTVWSSFTKAGSTMMPINSRTVVDKLIAITNAFDIDAALALFSPDAVIHDVSVGEQFLGHAGIGDYLKRYFVDYHTQTRFLSGEFTDPDQAQVRVNFTGDFGHEIGLLSFSFDPCWRIVHIDADLE